MRCLSRERRAHRAIVAIISCMVALGLVCAPVTARDLLIQHVTIVSPERAGPMEDVSVHIRDDRILRVQPSSVAPATPAEGIEVIDGKGLYLAPGLIDSHVHLGEIPGMTVPQEQANAEIAQAARAQIPRRYLYFGFTTLVDLNTTPAHSRNGICTSCILTSISVVAHP